MRTKNKLIMHSRQTPTGMILRSGNDVLLYLESMPEFATVSSGFIYEAILQAKEERSEYDNIEDLAAYLLANYI